MSNKQNQGKQQFRNPIPDNVFRNKEAFGPDKQQNVPQAKARSVLIAEENAFACNIKVMSLNVRKEPVRDSDIVGTINASVKAVLTSKKLHGDFYQVTGPFGIGYVLSEFVDASPEQEVEEIEEVKTTEEIQE
jgi:hypothetical protein